MGYNACLSLSIQHDQQEVTQKVSTNPFGSSDDEEDEVPSIQQTPKVPEGPTSTPLYVTMFILYMNKSFINLPLLCNSYIV